MAANAADYFKKASNGVRPVPTTLSAIHSTGGTTLTCVALTGWATTTGVSFCVYTTDTNGNKVAGTQTDWSGVVSGSTITNIVLKGGTDQNYSIGAVVEAAPIAGWADDIATGALVQHNQDGTHAAVTATSVTATGAITAGNGFSATGALTAAGTWDGWIGANETLTYASATTFTCSSGLAAVLSIGDKIKLTQTTAKYFYVTGISGTTITIFGGSDYTLANAAITSPYYSHEATPAGFPSTFNFTPVWTSDGSAPSIGNGTLTGQVQLIGKTCNVYMKFVGGSGTTWGSGTYFIGFPIAPVGLTGNNAHNLGGYMEDSGVLGYQLAGARTNGTTQFYVNYATAGGMAGWARSAPFTWDTGDFWSGMMTYFIG